MDRMGECCSKIWATLCRTKLLDIQRLKETELRRCLSVVDLTALGVGSTLGAGIYVLTGQVARTQTGPAIVISFLLAAFASFLAGICYAEFAARVPKAGSAYVYSYVSVGELWAFIIGWNMILENVIGAASSGKAWSQFLDALFNDTIRRSIESNVGTMHVAWLDSYPDFLAMSLLIVATVLICIGVKISSNVNFVFTVINLLVIAFVIGVGFFYSDIHNWTESPNGFFPFQFRGVIAGAATCFYSFVGFDTIATSGEESTNPTRHVPIAIVSTLVICLLAYVGTASVLTLMVPWNALAETAALPKAFAQRGIVGAEYVIAVGGMCGLTASIMGSIFPLPRNVYAMAQDRLVYGWLGRVCKRTDTPVTATVVTGSLVALSALLFDMKSLVEMMSIGTLMAYTLVAVSVLVLHYQRELVGLTADDMGDAAAAAAATGTGAGPGGGGGGGGGGVPSDGESRRRVANGTSGERISLSEDTGLLRVGEGSNRVRYVPTNTTTVVRRVKPPQDSDEEQPTSTPSAPPPTPLPPNEAPRAPSTTPDPPSTKRPKEASVVEEYRAKVQQQQRQQQQQQRQQQQPYGSTYHRLDSSSGGSFTSLSQILNAGGDSVDEPTGRTRRVVVASVAVLVAVWLGFCVLTVYGEDRLVAGDWWAVTGACVMGGVVLALTGVIAKQPRNKAKLNFSTPLVPLLPIVSVMMNIYLMVTLSATTWVRFAVWMTLGFIIYFGYGVWHSKERRSDEQEVILYDVADKDSRVVDGVYR